MFPESLLNAGHTRLACIVHAGPPLVKRIAVSSGGKTNTHEPSHRVAVVPNELMSTPVFRDSRLDYMEVTRYR